MIGGRLIGRKYGKLLVTKLVGNIVHNNKSYCLYECFCECGNISNIPSYNLSNKRTSCGCSRKEIGLRNKKGSYQEYSARAIWRGNYKDGCSLEKFLELSQQNCFYCGKPPSNAYNAHPNGSDEWKKTGTFIYNGLDRIDSSRDHSENNLVPCCKTCNWMKNKSSYNEFLEHISKIFKHMNLS